MAIIQVEKMHKVVKKLVPDHRAGEWRPCLPWYWALKLPSFLEPNKQSQVLNSRVQLQGGSEILLGGLKVVQF